MSTGVGSTAEEDVQYDIKGFRLFREEDYARTISGKGKSIMIYDPKVDYESPPVWENGTDPNKEETATVPPGCRVRVIGAIVTFTRQ
jgi:hypothetical protein